MWPIVRLRGYNKEWQTVVGIKEQGRGGGRGSSIQDKELRL